MDGMDSNDWNDRKCAVEAIQMMAQIQSLQGAMSVYRSEILEILGECKFDKVTFYKKKF